MEKQESYDQTGLSGEIKGVGRGCWINRNRGGRKQDRGCIYIEWLEVWWSFGDLVGISFLQQLPNGSFCFQPGLIIIKRIFFKIEHMCALLSKSLRLLNLFLHYSFFNFIFLLQLTFNIICITVSCISVRCSAQWLDSYGLHCDLLDISSTHLVPYIAINYHVIDYIPDDVLYIPRTILYLWICTVQYLHLFHPVPSPLPSSNHQSVICIYADFLFWHVRSTTGCPQHIISIYKN